MSFMKKWTVNLTSYRREFTRKGFFGGREVAETPIGAGFLAAFIAESKEAEWSDNGHEKSLENLFQLQSVISVFFQAIWSI